MAPVPHQAPVGRPVAAELRRARPDLRTAGAVSSSHASMRRRPLGSGMWLSKFPSGVNP